MAIHLHVPDMSCGHCVATITAAVRAIDAAVTLTPDLAARTLTVDANVPAERLVKALELAGYPARLLKQD